MKKLILFGLLLCFLLCGCNTASDSSFHNTSQPPNGEEQSAPSPEENDSAAERLAYYEQLVVALQEELLQVKSQLYAGRVEYEAVLAELKALQQSSGEKPPAQAVSDFQYTVRDGFAILTAYTGSSKEVEVPATLDGYTVLTIGDRAFSDNPRITSVTIPPTVTSIGWFAFSGCVSLEQINLPATVASISYGAFQNCPSTMTVTCRAGSYAEQYAVSYGLRIRHAS